VRVRSPPSALYEILKKIKKGAAQHAPFRRTIN
jgi:hypothetical protein